MIDVPDVPSCLSASSGADRAWNTTVRWLPGLREDAPKRNLVLLVAYLETSLLGFGLVQRLL